MPKDKPSVDSVSAGSSVAAVSSVASSVAAVSSAAGSSVASVVASTVGASVAVSLASSLEEQPTAKTTSIIRERAKIKAFFIVYSSLQGVALNDMT